MVLSLLCLKYYINIKSSVKDVFVTQDYIGLKVKDL